MVSPVSTPSSVFYLKMVSPKNIWQDSSRGARAGAESSSAKQILSMF